MMQQSIRTQRYIYTGDRLSSTIFTILVAMKLGVANDNFLRIDFALN